MPTPSVPTGERVYAIGDIHGRIDLFEDLIRMIEEDDAGRRRAHTTIVLLGDLIDRAATTMLHVTLDRVSPLAVPVLILIGREQVAQSAAEDALLIEAEALVTLAMRAD